MAPSGKNKKKDALQAINRPRAEQYRLDHDHAGYLRMLVDPHDSELCKQPSLVPRRGTLVRDVITVDVQGSCVAVARPSLGSTLALRSTEPTSTQSTDPWTCRLSGRSHSNVDFVTPPYYKRSDGVTAGANANGVVTLDGAAAGNWNYVITGKFDGAARVLFESNGINASVTYKGQPISGTLVNGVASGTFGLEVAAYRLDNQQADIDIQVELTPTTQVRLLAGGQHVVTHDTEVLTAVNDLRYYKIIAQSLFVSYMGSELNNGGTCSAALVNKDLVLGTITQSYDTLARLPYDSYDGRTSEGAHVHWLPENQMDFVPIYAAQDQTYQRQAAVAALLDDVTQTIRIRVTTIVEYFSDARAYGNMSYGPSWTDFDVFLALLHLHVPTATSNDTHVQKKLIKGVNKLGGMALKQAKAELSNPANWAKFMAMLM